MTRGRKRVHYQWNMDIWGEPGVSAEAELIGALFAALDLLGLARGAVVLRLNSRALLEESLRRGVLRDQPEIFEPLCVVIDKLDKIGADAVVEQLGKYTVPTRLRSATTRSIAVTSGDVPRMAGSSASHVGVPREPESRRRIRETGTAPIPP